VADRPTLGFLAGTGPLGQGLALRLALAGHEVLIGSRQRAKAEAVVAELLEGVESALPVRGVTNAEAAELGEVVYLMFPWEGEAGALPPLAGAIGAKVAVSVISPLAFDAGGPWVPPVAEGSAAQEAARLLPAARVVSAFHDVAAGKLRALDRPVDTDVLVCGDDAEAKAVVLGHADCIDGMRGVDAGPLRLSAQLEGLTAVLVSVNRRYRVRAGVKVSGLSDAKLAGS
jgi:NADPH-dependent F420 reductase